MSNSEVQLRGQINIPMFKWEQPLFSFYAYTLKIIFFEL